MSLAMDALSTLHRSGRISRSRKAVGVLVGALCCVVVALAWGGWPEEARQRWLRWGFSEQDVPPEISKEGWPHVEILQPRPGETLTGSVLLKWRGETPAGFGELEIRVDQRRVFQFLEPTWERALDTSFLPEGDHTIEIRLMDVDRRRGFARVDVTVRKPQFALLRVAHRGDGVGSNGREVVIDVSTSGEEFEPRADFSALDSDFDPARVRWRADPQDAGKLELSYRITDTNRRPDGNYWVDVALGDPQGAPIEQRKKLLVQLANRQQRRATGGKLLDIPCAIFRPEAVPPAPAVGAPFTVRGPSRVKVGSNVELSLDWQETTARPLLRVSVDGLFGHFVLLGSCGASDRVPIEALNVTDQPLRLALWPEQGLPVVHELSIVP